METWSILALVFLQASLAYSWHLQCPNNNWKLHGDRCFQAIHSQQKNWEDARKYCQQHFQGDLAEVFDHATNNVIKGIVNTQGSTLYWIGANDKDHEGRFVWKPSGQAVSFSYWNAGEPNNFGHCEDCVEINAMDGRWNDYNCYVAISFVCQVKATMGGGGGGGGGSGGGGGGGGSGLTCPHEWSLYQDKCIRAYNGHRTWHAARVACQHLKGDLVEIRDNNKNEFVRQLAQNHRTYWIGICDTNNDRVFETLDLKPITYAKWNTGEPNDYAGKEDCVQFHAYGKWNDLPCNYQIPYICEIPATGAPTGSCVDSSHHCPYWAGVGECDKNPNYMHHNCKRSCKKC